MIDQELRIRETDPDADAGFISAAIDGPWSPVGQSVTSTTHMAPRAPDGGLILSIAHFERPLNSTIFSGVRRNAAQGPRHSH